MKGKPLEKESRYFSSSGHFGAQLLRPSQPKTYRKIFHWDT